MSGNITTTLDRPYNQQPATRAAARRYLERTGNADLLDMLGLADEPGPLTEDGRYHCPACGQLLPVDGRKACRRRACATGPTARGVKR